MTDLYVKPCVGYLLYTFFLLFAISEYSPHDHSGPKGTMSSKLQIICFRKQKKTEKIRRNNISETETIRPLLVLLKDERKKEKKKERMSELN